MSIPPPPCYCWWTEVGDLPFSIGLFSLSFFFYRLFLSSFFYGRGEKGKGRRGDLLLRATILGIMRFGEGGREGGGCLHHLDSRSFSPSTEYEFSEIVLGKLLNVYSVLHALSTLPWSVSRRIVRMLRTCYGALLVLGGSTCVIRTPYCSKYLILRNRVLMVLGFGYWEALRTTLHSRRGHPLPRTARY